MYDAPTALLGFLQRRRKEAELRSAEIHLSVQSPHAHFRRISIVPTAQPHFS